MVNAGKAETKTEVLKQEPENKTKTVWRFLSKHSQTVQLLAGFMEKVRDADGTVIGKLPHPDINARFADQIYETDDPMIRDLIRKNKLYGREIWDIDQREEAIPEHGVHYAPSDINRSVQLVPEGIQGPVTAGNSPR